jgi:hypothetical protein
MSEQHKRKRDTTAAEVNKRTRPADEGIVLRIEDMPELASSACGEDSQRDCSSKQAGRQTFCRLPDCICEPELG